MDTFNQHFKNLVILITGSSHGIGKVMALNFAKLGAIVIINYHQSKKEAIETLKEITDQGGKAVIIKADISKSKEVRSMVKQIIKSNHRIDILINNAGGVTENSDWTKQTQTDWEKTISLNLTGCFNCLSIIGPIMLKQKFGKIINISSLRSILGAKDLVAYSASKAGVDNLTKSFAKILCPFVTVNCIAPSRMNCGMGKMKNINDVKNSKKTNLLNKLGNPLDVFYAAKFLSSPESDFITGQTLILDGGSSLK